MNKAWSSVSVSSLLFSPREPCLYVKLLPAAVPLAAMAMGIGIVYIFPAVVSLVCGASLGIYVEEREVIVQSVCKGSNFSAPTCSFSVVKKDTMRSSENSDYLVFFFFTKCAFPFLVMKVDNEISPFLAFLRSDYIV